MTRSSSAVAAADNESSRGVLLLSGGLDSTALAGLLRPTICLSIDYGQRPALAEVRAARAVCQSLGLVHRSIRIGLGEVGGGLLHDEAAFPGAPSPEWWPYRNQFLVTAAAAVAMRVGLSNVYIGTVAGDDRRHADGTQAFYDALNKVLAIQEGEIQVHAPALSESTSDLVRRSHLPESVLGWTVSCHRANIACGACPGCWKREQVLHSLGLLDHSEQR